MKFPETTKELYEYKEKLSNNFGFENISDVNLDDKGALCFSIKDVPIKIFTSDPYNEMNLAPKAKYIITHTGWTERYNKLSLEVSTIEPTCRTLEAVLQYVEYVRHDIPEHIARELVNAKYTLTDNYNKMNVSPINPLEDRGFLMECINKNPRFKEMHPELAEGKLYLVLE